MTLRNFVLCDLCLYLTMFCAMAIAPIKKLLPLPHLFHFLDALAPLDFKLSLSESVTQSVTYRFSNIQI